MDTRDGSLHPPEQARRRGQRSRLIQLRQLSNVHASVLIAI